MRQSPSTLRQLLTMKLSSNRQNYFQTVISSTKLQMIFEFSETGRLRLLQELNSIHKTYPIKDRFLSAQNLQFTSLRCVLSTLHVTTGFTSVASHATDSSPASASSMITLGHTAKSVHLPVLSNVERASLKSAIVINMSSRFIKKLKSTLASIVIRNLPKNTIGKSMRSQRKRNQF